MFKLLTVTIVFFCTAAAVPNPPGGKIETLDLRSFRIHPGNYDVFVSGLKPDSAIIVFKQAKSFEASKDSSQIFEITGRHISSYHLGRNDFLANSRWNRELITKLIELNEVAYLRVFYKNASGKVYKFQDLNTKSRKVSETILTDPLTFSLEIQKFYNNGNISIRSRYISGKRDSVERLKFDSLWYDISPKLVKSGQEDFYYPNQSVRLKTIYKNGVLIDSLYTEYYSDGKVKRVFSTSGGLLDGSSKTYLADGKLKSELIFRKGNLISTSSINTYDQNKKAFLYGIDKYEVPAGKKDAFPDHLQFKNLQGCKNDVDLLNSVLSTSCGFDPRNVISLKDDEATKKGISDAFERFTKSLKSGDIVFLHFSGHGHTKYGLPDSSRRYEGLYLPSRDYNYSADTTYANLNCIFQYELENFFNSIKKQIGKTGQLIVSLDVSKAGTLLSYGKEDTTGITNKDIARRGESNNVLFNLVKDENASVLIYSATDSDQEGFEAKDDNGKSIGAYTYAFARALTGGFLFNSAEIYDRISAIIREKGFRQNPGYLASETQYLFERSEEEKGTEYKMTKLPDVAVQGKTFVLSVGISEYPATNASLSFTNCQADARAYAHFFEDQYNSLKDEKNSKKIFSSLLLNKDATKTNILTAINNAISNSKPDDYFVFNFSGYCRPLKDSTGRQITYFIPYGLKSIDDRAEIKKSGIPLSQLKDLFQMIPANNQLFITEAGSTDDFQKEFIQALIETSPTIASLSNKNRIFIVPKGSGLDQFRCNGIMKDHGPLNYCVTSLSPELNVFGLFQGGVYADAVKFAFNKTEVDCDYFRTDYFDIFFEREFINSLRYFLPEDVMKSRGSKIIAGEQATVANAIARKYALIVGTNAYQGKPDWGDLDGIPDYDAKEIAKELEANFGFKTKMLIDKPSDSIYESILQLSRVLQPNDQLLVYVAGHGDYDEKLFDDGFIVCHNSKPVKDDPYRNSYIQYSKLSRMINKLPSKQIMMVLDVCFGGTFDERVARNKVRSKTTDYDDLVAETYLAEKLKIKTRLYLTSGGKKEVPNGYKGSHSPFAQRFLQCLQTKGGNGKILTATDFYQFVKMLPSGPLMGSFGDDEPGSEFIMLAK